MTFSEMVHEDLARFAERRRSMNHGLVVISVGMGFCLCSLYAAVFQHDTLGANCLLAAAVVAIIAARLRLHAIEKDRDAHRLLMACRYPGLYPPPAQPIPAIETEEM